MRIAIDIRSLIEPYPSGVSEYTARIVSELVRIESHHEFVLFSNSSRPIPSSRVEPLRALGVRFVEHAIPNKVLNSSLAFFSYPPLDRLVGGADVFLLPNINFFSCTKKCKTVLTVHDVSFRHRGFYTLKQRLWHRAVRFRSLLERSSRIIAVSESTSRDLQEAFRVPPERISVVSLGVDREQFARSTENDFRDVQKRYDLPDAYILSLGTVGPRKNAEGLMRAWESARKSQGLPYQLVIAGNVRDTRVMKKHPDVRFLGYVPESDKPALYRGARVFAYPSCYEGFGLPVYEAMAAGIPVVTSFSTSLPEISKGAAVLVDPYNTNEIAHALTVLAADEALRRSCIQRGRGIAENATWRRAASQTLSVFNSLV